MARFLVIFVHPMNNCQFVNFRHLSFKIHKEVGGGEVFFRICNGRKRNEKESRLNAWFT